MSYQPTNTSLETSYTRSVYRPVCSRTTAALFPPINFAYSWVQLYSVTSTTAGTELHRSDIFLVCKIQPGSYLRFAKPPPDRKTLAATSQALVAMSGANSPATKGSSFCKNDHSLFREALWIYTTNNYSDTVTLKRNPWSAFCDDISLIILNCAWLTNADSKLMSSCGTTEPGL